ncbi:MAG: histidine phosphatase family protein [Hyphomicrobiaceae bacterium]|jgi:alpha-ribazole phosphatase
MATLTRWWWVRHAPVPDGGFIYGQRDLDCDCGDAEVFATLARELPADAVWLTSNLVRTRQTAAAILAAAADGRHGAIEPQAVPDLAEQHLGEWQGLERRAFYESRRIGTHTLWFAAADERPPGGESFADLTARVFPAIERANGEHGGRDIVAVTHGGTIRAALALALAVPLQTALAFTVENCSLTRLDHLATDDGPGMWRVVAVNHRPWSRPGETLVGPGPIRIDRA